MTNDKQIKLLIESLEYRLTQVKADKELLHECGLLDGTCPLCRKMEAQDGFAKCIRCIAHSTTNICDIYSEKVHNGDRTKLMRWLRYQIRKWKKVLELTDCQLCKLMREKIPELTDKEIYDYHTGDRTQESFPRDVQSKIVDIMIEVEGDHGLL